MHESAPVALTTFVGRRRELQTLRRLLSSARFVTLVGPGGCGKTRLAIEVGRSAGKTEVAWVDLGPLRRAEDVQHRVARSLGVAHPDRIAEALATPEANRRALVVLDNCEHLLEAAADTAVLLLTASDRVRVLATSREPVDVEGEVVWRVPSLSVPDQLDASDPAKCARSDAVRLFLERARLAQPGFVLDPVTCPSVTAVVRAVDGLPLAIELAAARLRHMSMTELATQLDDLLSLLVGTRRGGDARHRELRAALDWSHALLDEQEQAVFRRLAVFAGGFRISAAQTVCAGDPVPASDIRAHVSSLCDKSLVVPPTSGERYRLLEPIREYALERLRAHSEEDNTTGRCAAHLVDLVTEQIPDPMGMGRGTSVRRVAEEFTNLTAILPWLIRERPADAVRVLARFAQNHLALIPGHVSAVSSWLDRALAIHAARDAARLEGLLGQVQLLSLNAGEHARARRAVDEALAVSIELGDRSLEARALSRSAFLAIWDDPARAVREYDVAVPMLRSVHIGALALALSGRAVLRQRAGDPRGAEEDIAEALASWARHTGPSHLRINALQAGADVAFQAGNVALAEARLREAIEVACPDDGSAPPAAFLVGPVEFLAHLAALRGDHERALRLSGSADRMRTETGVWPRTWFSLTDRSWLVDAETRLGPHARSLRAEGHRLSVGDAAAYALDERRPGSLTPRELSVARLAGDGLTDKEIAARLAISPRTAENHVQRIREKLGIRSRAQIGRWVAEHASPSAAIS